MTASTDHQGAATLEAQFAEDLSLFFESLIPRMAGRILGALACTDEPYLSAAELAQRLGASSGSVSTSVRLLEQYGFVERVARPGVRRDLFRMTEHPWRMFTDDSVRWMTGIVATAERAIDEFAGDTSSPAGKRLREMRDYYRFILDALPRLAREYEEFRAVRDAEANEPGRGNAAG